MVGVARLELATPRSQSECATNCATPRLKYVPVCRKYGVNDGARTRDLQNHNLPLCQLSYIHHIPIWNMCLLYEFPVKIKVLFILLAQQQQEYHKVSVF
jgi:hypothetical protein